MVAVRLFVLALSVLVVVVSMRPASATPIYTYDNDRYFVTDSSVLTWSEAETVAIGNGGHLASIHSRQQEKWLQDTFGSNWRWIGLGDAANWPNFAWSDGSAINYTDWGQGEPSLTNGDGGEREYYVGYNVGPMRQWNDFPSWYRLSGIIETPAPAPEPSVLTLFASGLAVLAIRRKCQK